MSDSVMIKKKQLHALQDAINTLHAANEELRERVQRAENNITILHAEITNTKQLAGHLAGRGMGSTVR